MEVQKHSGLGVASFIISVVTGVLLFLLIVIAGAIEASTPGGMDEESATAVVIGLFVILFLCVMLVALGLGVAGLLQKERKKIFAILGVVFSVFFFVVTLLLMLIGLAMG